MILVGAAFRGAGMSRQFRLTQEIRIKDVTLLPIEVDYSSEPRSTDEVYHTNLFGEFAPLGARKIMNFKRTTDFDFELKYGKLSDKDDKAFGLADIVRVQITGLTNVTSKIKDPNAERPKVRVSIELSDSGIISVTEASATIEAKEEDKQTLTDKVKSFFGAGSADDESTETPTPSAAQQNKTDNNATKTNDTEIIPKKEVKIEKVELGIKVTPLGVEPMATDEKLAAIKR
ncbi:hypothetical protein BC938DRAFT_473441 [Jimgerdemannia flammicorona]|uniref:Uncharacterized protein n=1 Tax=Jimgerdemannia flammicorona TaxID=994334 RepID=A0A433Q471_9FUNG|nr:hypothetical protein BC938DRAFT_473441 [Jimgerdemannia flammicorona]